MKRAVILHGTGNDPSQFWQPWLKQVLIEHGFAVLQPELPENDRPNRRIYNDFLFKQDWDYTDNVMFGHSSGATAIFNFLMDKRSPHIKTAVIISNFTEISPTLRDADWVTPGQFAELFPPEGFDWELIKSRCDRFYFVHSSDDPYCSIAVAHQNCERLEGTFIVIENGHHLGSTSGLMELPQMLSVLESDAVI